MKLNTTIKEGNKIYNDVAFSLIVSNTVSPEVRDTEGNIVKIKGAETVVTLNLKPYTENFELSPTKNISFVFDGKNENKNFKQLLNSVNDVVAGFLRNKKI